MELAVVRDLHKTRLPATPEELADFETDVLAGFVLARASAGLTDATIRGDVGNLEQVRTWFGRPLWELEASDADAYFGRVLRSAANATRHARAQALTTYFAFLELRHKVELHSLTGRVVDCPLDELNRPRGSHDMALRIPPSEQEVQALFAGWRQELATCRKYAPTARNYAAARLMADVGVRVNEARSLDLADVRSPARRPARISESRHSSHARRSTPSLRTTTFVRRAGMKPAGASAGTSRRCSSPILRNVSIAGSNCPSAWGASKRRVASMSGTKVRT